MVESSDAFLSGVMEVLEGLVYENVLTWIDDILLF